MRKVEQAIRGVEDEQWRRSDPEKSARADDMVAQLEAAIAEVEADLEKARAAGNDARRSDEHAAAIEARQSWLAEARKALGRVLRLTPELTGAVGARRTLEARRVGANARVAIGRSRRRAPTTASKRAFAPTRRYWVTR